MSTPWTPDEYPDEHLTRADCDCGSGPRAVPTHLDRVVSGAIRLNRYRRAASGVRSLAQRL